MSPVTATATERALRVTVLVATGFTMFLFTSATILYVANAIEPRRATIASVGASGQLGAAFAFLMVRQMVSRALRFYLTEKAATQSEYC